MTLRTFSFGQRATTSDNKIPAGVPAIRDGKSTGPPIRPSRLGLGQRSSTTLESESDEPVVGTDRNGGSNLSYESYICRRHRKQSPTKNNSRESHKIEEQPGQASRTIRSISSLPPSLSLESVTGSDRDDLETNVLELLSLQNVPSVKDESGLVHGVVDRLPVQVDKLFPLGDDDDGCARNSTKVISSGVA